MKTCPSEQYAGRSISTSPTPKVEVQPVEVRATLSSWSEGLLLRKDEWKPPRIRFVFIQSIADEISIDLASNRSDEIYEFGFAGDEFIKDRSMKRD